MKHFKIVKIDVEKRYIELQKLKEKDLAEFIKISKSFSIDFERECGKKRIHTRQKDGKEFDKEVLCVLARETGHKWRNKFLESEMGGK